MPHSYQVLVKAMDGVSRCAARLVLDASISSKCPHQRGPYVDTDMGHAPEPFVDLCQA